MYKATIGVWNMSTEHLTKEQADSDINVMKAAPKMIEVLLEAKRQIEYLHHKFTTTGSGNNVIAKIDNVLNQIK